MWCLAFLLPDDSTFSSFFLQRSSFTRLVDAGCLLRESQAAACASTSRLSWLRLALPHSRGSIVFPLGLDGPSPRDDIELSRLGRTFCRFWNFCCCSLVNFSAAKSTNFLCSVVRDFFLLGKELSLRARLCCTLVQRAYSGSSGVSTTSPDPSSSISQASVLRSL